MLKPRALTVGDQVAIVSLSSGKLGERQFIHKYRLARRRMERCYGLRVKVMPHALMGEEYLYRHPEARAADWMEAFRDPEIKAIFNAIGGDDAIRLLPYVDFDLMRQNPKIFTGFSDTTTNHFMLQRAGVVSYYGLSVMNQWGEYGAINPYTREAIEHMLFHPKAPLAVAGSPYCSYERDKIWWGEEHQNQMTPQYPNPGYQLLQGEGRVRGQLLGGCIDVFPELLGTPLWPSLEQWEGKLLLLETSEENMPPHILAWFLRNLQAQGILQVIRGILVGKPAYQEREGPYQEVYRRVVGYEAGRPELPILWNVSIGHAYPSGILPLGLRYEIDCASQSLTLLEPAVQPAAEDRTGSGSAQSQSGPGYSE